MEQKSRFVKKRKKINSVASWNSSAIEKCVFPGRKRRRRRTEDRRATHLIFPPLKKCWANLHTRRDRVENSPPLLYIYPPPFLNTCQSSSFFEWGGKRGQGRIFSTLFLLDLSRKMGRIFRQANFSLPFPYFFAQMFFLTHNRYPNWGKEAWRSIKWIGERSPFVLLPFPGNLWEIGGWDRGGGQGRESDVGACNRLTRLSWGEIRHEEKGHTTVFTPISIYWRSDHFPQAA